MKTTLFTLVLSFSLLMISCKKETKAITNDTIETLKNNEGNHCFLYIMENTYEVEGKKITDKDYISINLKIENSNVNGSYKVTSKEGIVSDGDFSGSIEKNIITGIQTYKSNGKVLKDEMVFKMDSIQISILGGEKKLIDGVNMFVDKSKSDYMMQLPRVECK